MRIALALAAVAVSPALAVAQTATTPTDEMLALLAPVPLSAKNPLLRPQRDYQGMRLGDWALYPALLIGASYDDNVAWTATRPVAAAGMRVAPTISAVREGDGKRLMMFGGADARLYPSATRANALNAEAGGLYDWRIAPDLTVKASAKYSHNAQPIGSGYVQVAGARAATLIAPLVNDRFQASLSAQKTFGRAFVGLSFETAKTIYAPLDTSVGSLPQRFRDSWVNTLTARAGAWVAPAIYVFAEGAGNKRDYAEGPFASKGYRAIAGVGSDRISLFRGELYGGVQQQFYEGGGKWKATSPVYGGNLFWYPLREVTVRAKLDQTFSESSLPSPGNPFGYPARSTVAELSVQHQIRRDLFAGWRLGYEVDRYMRTTRTDRNWRTGVGVVYSATRNIDVTLDYEYLRANSSEAIARYHRNAANAGLKYRF